MGKTKHTPAPWHTGPCNKNHRFDRSSMIEYSHGFIGKIGPVAGHLSEQDTANASRIVLCVNACEGIEDPAAYLLEVTTTLKQAHEALDTAFAMLIERDEYFFPSKSAMWPAMVVLHKLIKGGA